MYVTHCKCGFLLAGYTKEALLCCTLVNYLYKPFGTSQQYGICDESNQYMEG